MPNDDITDVLVDDNKVSTSVMPGDNEPKEERDKKRFLVSLLKVKLYTGDEVRGPEKGGAIMTYVEPPPQTLNDCKSFAATKKKVEEARKEADKLEKELFEAAGETKCVSDFRGIHDPEKRYNQAKEFKEALEKVPGVLEKCTTLEAVAIIRMGEAEEREEQNGGNAVANRTPPDKWNELRLEVMRIRSAVRDNGLPDGYAVTEGPEWHKTLLAELKPFAQGANLQDNENLRSQGLTAALSKDSKEKVAKAGGEFKEAIKPYLAKGVNRASLFFDATKNGVPLSLEDGKKAKAAMETLARQGMEVLNNGGSYKQVKALMDQAGLSEQFWPPELVQSIQAWRKTTRALQEERLRKVNESKTFTQQTAGVALKMIAGFTELSDSGATGTVEGWTELDESVRDIHADQVGASDDTGISGLVQTSSENAEVLQKIGEFMNGAVEGIDGVTSIIELMKTIGEMYKTGKEGSLDLDTALKQLDHATVALQEGLSTVLSGMTMAEDFGGDAVKELMKKIVPGLGLAVAGVEFANAIKDLAKKSVTLHQTRGTKNEGLAMFVTDDVDEAMLYAMNNALDAERKKVAKASIQVGTTGLEVIGNTASTFGGHFGAAAGSALAITASGITLGSKAIFSRIDWGKANKAKKLLAEANAGNMDAQVEIFEQSNLYAKMFLAISVKEGSPLAKKYLVDRGIEEGDLDRGQSLEVLRDAMLNAAEQSNEQETEDSLAMHIGGKPLKAVVGGAKLVGNLATNVKERAVRLKNKPYNKAAANTAAAFTDDPETWVETWASAKQTHIANGLLDVSTGITAALTNAAEAHKAASDEPESKEKLLAAIDAMNKALQTNLSAKPVGFEAEGSPKRIPHAQAYASLKQMRVEINKRIEAYWFALDTLDDADPNWTPAKIAGVTATAWQGFWNAGKKAVAFPDADGGVGEAIKEAEKAKAAFEKEEDDGREKRKLAVAYVAELDDVNEALLECLDIEAVNRRVNARAAINDLLLLVNADRQKVDSWLAGYSPEDGSDDWAGPEPDFSAIAAADFVNSYDKVMKYADEAGFLALKGERGKGKGDGGLRDALESWQKSYVAYESAQAPKDILAAIRSAEENAGRVKKRALQFLRAQRAGSDQVKGLAQAISEHVVKRTTAAVEDFESTLGTVDFALPTGKTPLSSENWRTLYDNAVEAGAVLESRASRKALSKALKDVKSDGATFQKALTLKSKDKAKKIRTAARTYCESLNNVEGTIEMVRGLKRYGKNAKLAGYLDTIVTAVQQARSNDLVAYAGGTKNQAVAFTAPTKLEVKNWQENKKKAEDEGVISDRKTGIAAAIGDYLSAGTDKAKKRTAAMKLRPMLEEAGNDSEYEPWHKYVEKVLELAPVP